MTIPYNKVTAVIELANIVHNYHVLQKASGAVIPVIKADAYGHGLSQVAQALNAEGADTFAVGTVEEAVALRASGQAHRVIALLGPVEDHEYRALWSAGVVAFFHSFDQLDRLAAFQKEQDEVLPIALKFDTGMRRLGFTLVDVPAVAARIKAMRNVRLEYVSSHLATADEPEALAYVNEQAEEFAAIRRQLVAHGLPHKANIANSAGILGHPDLHLDNQRAGIALYGCSPFHGTSRDDLGRDLKPAMSVKTKILSVHPLKAGQTISYGCTFKAQQDMQVAIVAAGYADAYSRGLTGKAQMCLKDRRVPVLGRVCMQMCAVDVTGVGGVRAGDEIWLLGGEGEGRVTPEDLAGWWGTITYEVFCLLGLNKREYV
jgi:alanine racemase